MTGLPLSRPLRIATVPAEGLTVEIVANEPERAALAALNEALSIERLVARVDVRPRGRDGFAVGGEVAAELTRTCVVTLEPFSETVRETIDMRFSSDPAAYGAAEADDPPDPIEDGSIDLGSVVSEFLTLALDPHPRKPGATFDADAAGATDDSPFAALRKLTRVPKP